MLTYQQIDGLNLPKKTYEILISPTMYMHLTCAEMYEFYKRKNIPTYLYKNDPNTLDIVPATEQEILCADSCDFCHYLTLYPLDLDKLNNTFTSSIHCHTTTHKFKEIEYRSDPTLISMYNDGLLERFELVVVDTPFNICYREDDSEYIQTPNNILWEFYE